jgi:hypothetical protein
MEHVFCILLSDTPVDEETFLINRIADMFPHKDFALTEA